MIIVCTKDGAVVNWTNNNQSGANLWGNAFAINPMANQDQATQMLCNALAFLGLNEPLCLTAHGNDIEMGDPGNGPYDWTWNVNLIAGCLAVSVPAGYTGPILIRICANQITNFSARLAVSLQNGQALNGVWIYGYNRAVPMQQAFPNPANLANQVDLQGTQVVY